MQSHGLGPINLVPSRRGAQLADPLPAMDEMRAPTPGYQFTGPVPAALGEALDRVARFEANAASYRALAARHQPLSAESEAAMAQSQAAQRNARAARHALRSACDAFVRRLKDTGAPPQHVLIAVKTIVRDAARRSETPWDAHPLTREVVQWSIDAYYPPDVRRRIGP